jgi:hypothetical protein
VRIHFERSGGIANIPSTVDLDTSTLPASKVKRVKKLLQKARFFDQPSRAFGSHQARDEYQYQVTITDGTQTHTIETTDTALSPDLVKLIEWLETEAAAKRKR